MKKIYIIFLIFLSSFSTFSQTNCYWNPSLYGGTTNWSDGNSWVDNAQNPLGVAPGSSDIVTFEATIGDNSNCTIDITVNVASITLNTDYTGTITQNLDVTTTSFFQIKKGTWNQGNTLSIGGAFTINGGTFTGASSDINVTGSMSITSAAGSSFQSTSGNLQISGTALSVSNTFLHNSGTFTFNNATATTLSGTSTATFFNIVINSGMVFKGKASANFNVAGNWTNNNTFTHNSGTVTFTGVDKNITGSATTIFNNLTTNISGDGKIIIPSGKTVTVSGTLEIGTTDTLMVDVSSGGVNGSLITNGTITNNGTCKLKTAVSKNKWHCVSSAVSTINIETVFDNPTSNGRKYYLETDATNFWQPVGSNHTGSMTVGKGYYIYYSANKYERYSGTFNNANASPAITYGVRNFNLVGNPFPCAISWATVYASTANVDGSIQIRNGTSWTVISQLDASPYVQPGQGFFVKASASSPTITIGTSARLHNASGAFLKSASPYTCLNLKISSDSLNSITRFFFLNDATNEFDHPYDADKLWDDNSNVPELFSMSSQSDTLALNALPLILQDTVIPLGINAGLAGTYTINADELINFDPNIIIYLEDIESSTITNLNTNPNYTFIVSSPTNKNISRFNLRFSFSTPPQIVVQPASVIKCQGEPATLFVTPNNAQNLSYQWYNAEGAITGATSDSLIFNTVTAVDANDYYCIISNQYGTVQSLPATLTVNASAQISQSPVSTINCEGETATLSVVASGTDLLYQWQKDGQDIINEVNASLQFSQLLTSDNGNYTCIVTNLCNSLTSDVATITVNSFPVVDLGTNQTVCEGTAVTLDAGNIGATYLWNDLSTNQLINPLTSGTYTVAVTKDGCTSNASVDITMIPNPVVNLGSDISVCTGTLVTLNAGNNGTSYLWNDNSTNQQFTTSVSGTYSVTVTKNGCTTVDEINVTFNSFPVVNLGNNQTICEGTPVVLDAGNIGATYLWNDLSTNQQISPSASGIYEVTVTNNGCSSSDYVFINFKPVPVVDLGADISSCENDIITLDAGYITGNNYLWSNGSHNQMISPNSTGIYAVTVTNNGCSGTDEVNVEVNAIPVVNLGNDQILCEGATVTLDAGNIGATYFWNNSTTNQQINPSFSGTYSVTVTDNACSGTDAVTITFKPAPVVDLGADISVCEGEVVNLDAGYITGNSYVWTNGSHNEFISTTVSGDYSVTVTNNGCTGTDQINVIVNSNPVADLGPDIAICSGCTEILDAGNSGATYTWSTNETTQTINVTVAGTYTVTVTSSEGCSDIDEIIVDVVSGIESISVTDMIELYPNPAVNYVTISSTLKGVYNIEVADITGKIIFSLQTGKNLNNLNISYLEKGVYLMRISNSEKQFIKTFIKQ